MDFIKYISKEAKPLIIYKDKDILINKMSIKYLLNNYKIENWSKNRPPDQVRIEQIKLQYTNTQKQYISDGIISAWKKPDSNTLYIYDGIHRLMGTKDFFNNIIIIKMIITNDEQLIIDDFKKINLAVSLPYLYLEDHNKLKVSVCENVMKLMCEKWKENISPSRNPWKCNFNRDVFIDSILSKLNIDYTTPNIDKVLFDIIIGVNQQAKKFIEENKIEIYKKCNTYNFYIMYLSNETIINKIQESNLL